MAANISFKIACPSCEAMVPVRDPALVGKKIDCPKCKYRFVVEDPNEETFDDGVAAPKKKTSGRSKKKAGGNNVLILGSILGLVAVALLGVGGYFMFFAGEPSKPSPSPAPVARVNPAAENNASATPTPAAPAVPPDPNAAPAAPGAEAPKTNTNPAPAPPVDAGLPVGLPTAIPFGDITNLLPNDAQSVMSIHMDKMRACTLGQQSFESRVGFRPELFKQKLGIGVEDIVRFVRGENMEGGWSVNVLRTSRPVTLDEMKSALGLQKGNKSPIKGREYYTIAPNELLDNLGKILQAEIESRNAIAPGPAKKTKAGPLTILMVDPTTLVIAHQDPMEEFLQAGGKWEPKSRPAESDPAAPPAEAPTGGEGAAATGAQFTTKATFLTVEPSLKAMMDRLEGDGLKVIATVAQRLQSDPKIVQRIRDVTGIRDFTERGMEVLGVALNEFDSGRFKGEAMLKMFREPDAKVLEDAVKDLITPAGQALGLYLGGLRIDVESTGSSGGGGDDAGRAGGGSGEPGRPAPPRVQAQGPGGDSGRSSGGSTGNSGNPDENTKNTLKFNRRGSLLTLALELNLTIPAYDRLYGLAEGSIIRMKGMVDMADSSPRWHELGKAAVDVRSKDGMVPRGTFPRDENVGGRLARSWPPQQRVSWLAALLPYLGHEDLYNRIDRKKSWRDAENLKQGAILVPQFLNPSFPRPSWRANVPSLGSRDQGATHVVGVAGVGLDAAEYRFDDPSVSKKIGMVGYDRRANIKDVTDGASNTIYMIQVPANLPRPWIAGGGATVMGVPETRSIDPFAVATGSGGKRGATVIMADGSVRFIADGVSDDVFKALATIRGGEEIVDLEKQAPKVDPKKKGAELKTASAASSGDAKP